MHRVVLGNAAQNSRYDPTMKSARSCKAVDDTKGINGDLPAAVPVSVNNDMQLISEFEAITAQLNPHVEWDDRVATLLRLEGILIGKNTAQFPTLMPELIASLLARPLSDTMTERRSALSRQACHTVTILATTCGSTITESALSHFLPATFKAQAMGIAVVTETANIAARQLIRHCISPRVLSFICDIATSDKNTRLRHSAAAYILEALQTWPSHVIERHLTVSYSADHTSPSNLGHAIIAIAQDAQVDTRALGRQAFAALSGMFPLISARILSRLPHTERVLKDRLVAAAASNSTSDEYSESSSSYGHEDSNNNKMKSRMMTPHVSKSILVSEQQQHDDDYDDDDQEHRQQQQQQRTRRGRKSLGGGALRVFRPPHGGGGIANTNKNLVSSPTAAAVTGFNSPRTATKLNNNNMYRHAPLTARKKEGGGGHHASLLNHPPARVMKPPKTPSAAAVLNDHNNNNTVMHGGGRMTTATRVDMPTTNDGWGGASSSSSPKYGNNSNDGGDDGNNTTMGFSVASTIPRLLSSLEESSASQWSERAALFECLQGTLVTVTLHTVETIFAHSDRLMTALVAGINESHFKIALPAFAALSTALITPVCAAAFEIHLDRCVPQLFSRAVDLKEAIRVAAFDILDMLPQYHPPDAVLTAVVRALTASKSPKIKVAIMQYLINSSCHYHSTASHIDGHKDHYDDNNNNSNNNDGDGCVYRPQDYKCAMLTSQGPAMRGLIKELRQLSVYKRPDVREAAIAAYQLLDEEYDKHLQHLYSNEEEEEVGGGGNEESSNWSGGGEDGMVQQQQSSASSSSRKVVSLVLEESYLHYNNGGGGGEAHQQQQQQQGRTGMVSTPLSLLLQQEGHASAIPSITITPINATFNDNNGDIGAVQDTSAAATFFRPATVTPEIDPGLNLKYGVPPPVCPTTGTNDSNDDSSRAVEPPETVLAFTPTMRQHEVNIEDEEQQQEIITLECPATMRLPSPAYNDAEEEDEGGGVISMISPVAMPASFEEEEEGDGSIVVNNKENDGNVGISYSTCTLVSVDKESVRQQVLPLLRCITKDGDIAAAARVCLDQMILNTNPDNDGGSTPDLLLPCLSVLLDQLPQQPLTLPPPRHVLLSHSTGTSANEDDVLLEICLKAISTALSTLHHFIITNNNNDDNNNILLSSGEKERLVCGLVHAYGSMDAKVRRAAVDGLVKVWRVVGDEEMEEEGHFDKMTMTLRKMLCLYYQREMVV